MARKPTKKDVVEAVETVEVAETPVFTPCRQCGNPGDCMRAAKCQKGFK